MVNIKKFSRFISFIALFIFLNNINYIPVSALYTENHMKTVYLTFDDGPSVNITKELINILNENNIKATFFVVGDSANIYPYMIKSLNESGMCIMPHCNMHDYTSLYKSEENYFKDLDKCKSTIESILGKRNLNFIRLTWNILAVNTDSPCDNSIPKPSPIAKDIIPTNKVSIKIIFDKFPFSIPKVIYIPNSFFLLFIK